MWQFSEAIDGIAEACRVLETPITGGNVSFYNETLGKPIYPTPVLGVLGLIEDAGCALWARDFANEGDVILLLDGAGARWRPEVRRYEAPRNFRLANMRRRFMESWRARRRRLIWPRKSG